MVRRAVKYKWWLGTEDSKRIHLQDWNHSCLRIFLHLNLNDQGSGYFILRNQSMGNVLWNEFQSKRHFSNTLTSPKPVFVRWFGDPLNGLVQYTVVLADVWSIHTFQRYKQTMAAFFSLIKILASLNIISKYSSEVFTSLPKWFYVDKYLAF